MMDKIEEINQRLLKNVKALAMKYDKLMVDVVLTMLKKTKEAALIEPLDWDELFRDLGIDEQTQQALAASHDENDIHITVAFNKD